MTNEQAFEMLGSQVAEIVLISLKNELIKQGHKMDGSLIDSISYAVKAESTKAIIDFSFLEYGMVLNYGVTPDRIPYTQGSGKKTSKFIDGLKKFAEKKLGKSGKEAEKVAFAIARKMKAEGMPTKGSRAMGNKLNWIGLGLEDANPKVVETINKVFEEVINGIMIQAFAEISKKNSDNLKVTIK